jgi:Gas vesicle synthesis protein GvpL/GvpF
MTTYLYCLSEASGVNVPSLRGLDGAPVRAVDAGPLRAWVSDLDEAAVMVSVDRVRAHDVVVRAVLETQTPLPARFGQTFPDDTALRTAVERRREALLQAAARVRGTVEMTVRALLDPSPAAGGNALTGESGREYLAGLRERQRVERQARSQADFLHKRISDAVLGTVREEARAPARSSACSLSVSHLVPRDAVTGYRLTIRALIESDPQLRLMVSGPWAPYSFAELRGV